VGDIDLKVISATGNSIFFKKTRFWKEKSVEDLVTLGHTSIYKVTTQSIAHHLKTHTKNHNLKLSIIIIITNFPHILLQSIAL
jgi:hypothetical protein